MPARLQVAPSADCSFRKITAAGARLRVSWPESNLRPSTLAMPDPEGLNRLARENRLLRFAAMTTTYTLLTGLFLVLGILTSRFAPNSNIALAWPGSSTTYGFELQTFCNALALLFCFFAFIYSIGYIPFGPTTTRWHLWLSLAGVALLIAGQTGLGVLASRGTQLREGTPVTLIGLSLIVGLGLFLIAQFWFAVGFARALMRMRVA